jgi:threonine/homoserine efflux transporter RhtA
MSANTSDANARKWPRLSLLAVASFLCGVAASGVGIVTVIGAGSDLSDLLTLTLPAFLLAAAGLCIAAYITPGMRAARLCGTGIAAGGAALAALVFVGIWLLIPAM